MKIFMRLTPLLTAGFLLVLGSCGGSDFGTIDSLPNQAGVSAAENFGSEDIDFIMQHDPDIIKTTKGARELDLETPLRCRVSWNKQELIAAVPYNMTAFNLVRNGVNDILPRYEVNGFSFKSMPAEKALLKLDKEAGIHLIARDAPYASISGENLRGEFSEVVKMITDAAEIFILMTPTEKSCGFPAGRILHYMFRIHGRLCLACLMLSEGQALRISVLTGGIIPLLLRRIMKQKTKLWI